MAGTGECEFISIPFHVYYHTGNMFEQQCDGTESCHRKCKQ